MENITVAATLIVALFAIIANSRLTHWRDRRREFNEISKTVYSALCKQLDVRDPVKVSINVNTFIPYISPIKRGTFRACVTRYCESNYHTHDYDTSTGIVKWHDAEVDKLMAHVEELIPYFEPR